MQQTRGTQVHAFAPGTFDNLVYQWVKYLNFCDKFSLPALPASTAVLSWYAQYIANLVKAHATVVNYLSRVKTLHILLELDTAMILGILLKLTVWGLRCMNTLYCQTSKTYETRDSIGYQATIESI